MIKDLMQVATKSDKNVNNKKSGTYEFRFLSLEAAALSPCRRPPPAPPVCTIPINFIHALFSRPGPPPMPPHIVMSVSLVAAAVLAQPLTQSFSLSLLQPTLV